MKRDYLVYAALALVVIAAYYSREGFGPSTDINLGMNPAPTGRSRERETCGDKTRADVGECSLDSHGGEPTYMPY